jgi:hemerythrin-like domain-containing protein
VRLLDELRAEHDLIETVLGSLRAFVDLRVCGQGEPADAKAFLGFFRHYAAGYHHAREEDVLFPALVKEAELPPDKGPLPAVIAQHHSMAAMLDELAPLLGADLAEAGNREKLVDSATRYSRALWAHIDAENSVMLPESEKRLRRVGVLELDGRGPTAQEEAARADGERLVSLYPPIEDRGAVRGEGCVICASYGVDCDGVEREWWNESEWEEFPDHL